MDQIQNHTQWKTLSECPVCHGKGIILYEDENGYVFQKACTECTANKDKDIAYRLEIADLPAKYKDVSLKDIKTSVYSTQKAKEMIIAAGKGVKWWLDNIDNADMQGKGLYLVSKTKGTGKTMCACAIVNELVRNRGKRVKYITQNKILENIKASWEDKHREGSEIVILNNLQKIDYLVIDEFGEVKANDWVNEKFYSILNARYEAKKPTIFTSNISLKDAQNYGYDERITDRIAGTCGIIFFPDESVRVNDLSDFQKKMNEVMGGVNGTR